MFSILSVASLSETAETERSSSPSAESMSTTTAEEWNQVCSRDEEPPTVPDIVPAPESVSSWSQVSGTNTTGEAPPTVESAEERRHCELCQHLTALREAIEALARDVRGRGR